MMISCHKAADLLCQSLDRPLSLRERWQLRFHLWMCWPCTEFEQQNQAILELIENHFRGDSEQSAIDPQLEKQSREACERMKQRLHDAIDHGASNRTYGHSHPTER